jgi:hypothetical protein
VSLPGTSYPETLTYIISKTSRYRRLINWRWVQHINLGTPSLVPMLSNRSINIHKSIPDSLDFRIFSVNWRKTSIDKVRYVRSTAVDNAKYLINNVLLSITWQKCSGTLRHVPNCNKLSNKYWSQNKVIIISLSKTGSVHDMTHTYLMTVLSFRSTYIYH